MHSIHGLFRGKNLELGRDEDTGGQIIYVLELAKALAKLKQVDKVDIITRKIVDKSYPGYSKDIEKVGDKVNIVRIECGPKEYIKKVHLWPYIDEFIDNCKKYIKKLGRKPDILHSNYADSGYVCVKLSKMLKIPQVHTGHSLGKPKMERLGVNDKNFKQMDKIYNFTKRLKAEQLAIDNASAIVVSTEEERIYQYGAYHIDTKDKRFNVIFPGVDLDMFYHNLKKLSEEEKRARKRIFTLIENSIEDTSKPMVFSISRLDFKKNLAGLVKAYASDHELREMANLVLVTGRLGKLGKHQKVMMDEIRYILAKHKIFGKLCIIKHIGHSTETGPMYRIIYESKGVFVNPALHEPFGITILEAGATGIPVVATNNGGPVEILGKSKNGILVNPGDAKEIASAIKSILKDKKKWKKYSGLGVKNVKKYYSWDATAKSEYALFKRVISGGVKN